MWSQFVIVGAPNVGKSTIFNALTNTRAAIVDKSSYTTRDRQYHLVDFTPHPFILVDTGGLVEEASSFKDMINQQSIAGLNDADAILFVVDGNQGCSVVDERIMEKLRKYNRPIFLIIHRAQQSDWSQSEFLHLGANQIFTLPSDKEVILARLSDIAKQSKKSIDEYQYESFLKISILGRPNVGKSTLSNCILNDDRIIESNIAGTTTSAISVPFTYQGHHCLLIDTAGIRRKKSIHNSMEKAAITQSLQAMKMSDVAIIMIDGQEGCVDQDLKLIAQAIDNYKPFIIAINKVDVLDKEQQEYLKRDIQSKFHFFSNPVMVYISAKSGTGIQSMLKKMLKIKQQIDQDVPTAHLNLLLKSALENHEPPMIDKRRPKIKYAHLGNHNPFSIVLHGTRLSQLPKSYLRYLQNHFRKALNLIGIPLHLKLVDS